MYNPCTGKTFGYSIFKYKKKKNILSCNPVQVQDSYSIPYKIRSCFAQWETIIFGHENWTYE